MSKIYKDQDYTLTLESCVDLTAATELEIHYLKPGSDTPVEKTASAVDSTKAQVQITESENDTSGSWRFQIYAVLTGKKRWGETFKLQVYPAFQ